MLRITRMGMINDALTYALQNIAVPRKRALWLYGDPAIAFGDVYHPWHSKVHALENKGCNVFSTMESLARDYDAVIVECPKQREETQGLIALALLCSGRFVMLAAPNNAGGTRLRKTLEAYGVKVEHMAKHHCQVVWTWNSVDADKEMIASNLSQLVPKQITMEGQDWWTQPGLFAWNKIDAGSKLLLQHLPANLAGKIADFGCGYGYLCAMMAKQFPGITHIDAYDGDIRAVACATSNNSKKVDSIWQDMRGFAARPLYDAVVMNPPFHDGKEEDVELGRIFITKALASLKSGGRLFMVANRHLGYEQKGLTVLVQKEGYKIMTARAS